MTSGGPSTRPNPPASKTARVAPRTSTRGEQARATFSSASGAPDLWGSQTIAQINICLATSNFELDALATSPRDLRASDIGLNVEARESPTLRAAARPSRHGCQTNGHAMGATPHGRFTHEHTRRVAACVDVADTHPGRERQCAQPSRRNIRHVEDDHCKSTRTDDQIERAYRSIQHLRPSIPATNR